MATAFDNTNNQFATMMGQVSSLLKQAEEDKAATAVKVGTINSALGLDSSDPNSNIMFLGQQLAEETRKVSELQQQYLIANSGKGSFFDILIAPTIRDEAAIRAQNAQTLQVALEGNQKLALNQAKVVQGESPDNTKTIGLIEKQMQLLNSRSAAEANAAQKQAALAQAGLFNAQRVALKQQEIDAKTVKGTEEADRLAAIKAAAVKLNVNPDIITKETIKDGKRLTAALGNNVEAANALMNVASSATGQLAANPIDALGALKSLPLSTDAAINLKRQEEIRKLESIVNGVSSSITPDMVSKKAMDILGVRTVTEVPPKKLSEAKEQAKNELVKSALLSQATSGLGTSFNKLSLAELAKYSDKLIVGDEQLQKYFNTVPAIAAKNKFADDTVVLENFVRLARQDKLTEQEQAAIITRYYTRAKQISDSEIDKNMYGIPVMNSYNAIVNGSKRDLLKTNTDVVLILNEIEGRLKAGDKMNQYYLDEKNNPNRPAFVPLNQQRK